MNNLKTGSGISRKLLNTAGKASRRAEEALRFRADLQNVITTISTNFINLEPEEIDSGINTALHAIGEFIGVDRSYVVLFSNKGTKMDATYEWCAEEVEPQIDNLNGMPREFLPWLMEKLNRFENVYIPRVANLPPEASAEKEILQSHAVKSAIFVPMTYGMSAVGFLGFGLVRGEKRRLEDSIVLMRLVGEIFVDALERKRADEKIKYMTVHDALTDLYNRAYFVEKMKEFDALKKYPLNIVIGDIDNFKEMNDNFGHQFGDEILKNLVMSYKP